MTGNKNNDNTLTQISKDGGRKARSHVRKAVQKTVRKYTKPVASRKKQKRSNRDALGQSYAATTMAEPVVRATTFRNTSRRLRRTVHWEYVIPDVMTGSGVGYQRQLSFHCNPGNAYLFGNLTEEAGLYDKYRFKSLSIEYMEQAATLIPGSLAMAFDYDAGDTPSVITGMAAFLEQEGAVQTVPYRAAKIVADTSMFSQKSYYTEITTSDDTGALARQNDACDFRLVTDKIAPNTNLGALRVVADIEFMGRRPATGQSLLSTIAAGTYSLQTSAGTRGLFPLTPQAGSSILPAQNNYYDADDSKVIFNQVDGKYGYLGLALAPSTVYAMRMQASITQAVGQAFTLVVVMRDAAGGTTTAAGATLAGTGGPQVYADTIIFTTPPNVQVTNPVWAGTVGWTVTLGAGASLNINALGQYTVSSLETKHKVGSPVGEGGQFFNLPSQLAEAQAYLAECSGQVLVKPQQLVPRRMNDQERLEAALRALDRLNLNLRSASSLGAYDSDSDSVVVRRRTGK